ncbi:MAG: universal stress protein [Acidobacteria bacterium]|nr:universal stress protein [Acidobacteriota bacterium]MBV9475383.1 universal stress protein [Acidobacteriota bacterium]
MARASEPRRPDPDELLRLAGTSRDGRGRLAVYLGMAAGVGKTVRMLDDAHAARRAGIDVVLGFVETHGRIETAQRIGELEQIARRTVVHRGVTIDEMDVDAILARHADLVVVDELPHTNAPASRNEKRWQDVEEILASGASVMTALNVQHLEGVQDVVRSATGIDIRERVPDRILRDAHSVVLVDIPVPELLERLRAGKIYPPEQAARALGNFFRAELLTRLRELALLQTATFSGAAQNGDVTSEVRLAVAVPFDPEIARPLLLRASRIAGRMNTRWFALYVRQEREHPRNITAEEHRKLSENVQLAIALGATVVTRESEDIAGAICAFAAEARINLLVVGKPTRPGFFSRFVPSIVHKLLDRGGGFDLVIVDTARAERP